VSRPTSCSRGGNVGDLDARAAVCTRDDRHDPSRTKNHVRNQDPLAHADSALRSASVPLVIAIRRALAFSAIGIRSASTPAV